MQTIEPGFGIVRDYGIRHVQPEQRSTKIFPNGRIVSRFDQRSDRSEEIKNPDKIELLNWIPYDLESFAIKTTISVQFWDMMNMGHTDKYGLAWDDQPFFCERHPGISWRGDEKVQSNYFRRSLTQEALDDVYARVGTYSDEYGHWIGGVGGVHGEIVNGNRVEKSHRDVLLVIHPLMWNQANLDLPGDVNIVSSVHVRQGSWYLFVRPHRDPRRATFWVGDHGLGYYMWSLAIRCDES